MSITFKRAPSEEISCFACGGEGQHHYPRGNSPKPFPVDNSYWEKCTFCGGSGTESLEEPSIEDRLEAIEAFLEEKFGDTNAPS